MKTAHSYLFEQKLNHHSLADVNDSDYCIIKLSDQIPLKILIVDDNELNLRLLSVQFRLHGYEVDIASNGLIACEMAGEKNYDLICMDIHMPGLSGFDSSKRILKHSRKKQPYIVACTSCNYEIVKDKLGEAGIAGFYNKPLSIKNIQQLILTTAALARNS